MANTGLSSIAFERRGVGSWLGTVWSEGDFRPFPPPEAQLIEARAAATNATGEHDLWEGYQALPRYKRGATRTPDRVRSKASLGQIYAWLAATRKSPAIVEFGTAFGVSGMYWLAGLKRHGGRLFTFEPNAAWAALAAENLTAISSEFTATVGTFEENAARVLTAGQIDIGFIDAIHTGVFVRAQLAILRPFMRPGGIILFDDIAFSEDMQDCWRQLAVDESFVTTGTIGSRVGFAELHG